MYFYHTIYRFPLMEGNLMAIMHVFTNPVLSLQPGILRGGMVSDCVREVSLAQIG